MPLFRLRDITPKGLYARSLAMLLVPLVVILSLMTWFYYDTHIAEVNRKLAQAVARDASLVEAHCLTQADDLSATVTLTEFLGLSFTCDHPDGMKFPAYTRNSYFYAGILRRELKSQLGIEAETRLDPKASEIDIRFPSGDAIIAMQVNRKRVLAINSHIFIVWVILFSLLMVALAVGFLNQQVRSILRLSDAAKAFGRGRDVPDFRPSGATEVREAARSVIDMKNRLTAFADQRTAMLAGVSHDLRTPLTRLKLALAMMEDSDDIKAARRDLDDMSAMLDGYLDFASGEEGDEPSALDVASLSRNICQDFGSHISISGPASVMITGRKLALKRAISNLVSNALKYGTKVRVTIVDGPHAAEIIIDDDGPGIPQDKHEDAFRPFVRLEEARTQNTSGTGLGLTLARDTARAHGGDVRLSKSPLGGLRVVLRLPH